MIVDRLREIAESFGWDFNYGRGHWQNLKDYEDDTAKTFEEAKKHFLLWWVDEEDKDNAYGVTTSIIYDLEFYLTARSRITDDAGMDEHGNPIEHYNYKYEHRIKHLKQEARRLKAELNDCDGSFGIEYWKMIEVENQLDTNLDGVKVTVRVRRSIK